jgi:hypothetical protein
MYHMGLSSIVKLVITMKPKAKRKLQVVTTLFYKLHANNVNRSTYFRLYIATYSLQILLYFCCQLRRLICHHVDITVGRPQAARCSEQVQKNSVRLFGSC